MGVKTMMSSHINTCSSFPHCSRLNMRPGRTYPSLDNIYYQHPRAHWEAMLFQKHQSLLNTSGFTVHFLLPKSEWIAWFERHLFLFSPGSQDDPLAFPIINPCRTTCLCTNNVNETKHGFQVTDLPQSAYRLSQGSLWS